MWTLTTSGTVQSLFQFSLRREEHVQPDRQVPGIPAQVSKHSGVAGVAVSGAQRVAPKLRPRGTAAVSCRGIGEEIEQETHGFGQGTHGNRTVWDSNAGDTNPCLPIQLPKAHQHRGEQWWQPGPGPTTALGCRKRTKGNGTLQWEWFQQPPEIPCATSTSQKLNWRIRVCTTGVLFSLSKCTLADPPLSSNALRLQGIKKMRTDGTGGKAEKQLLSAAPLTPWYFCATWQISSFQAN